MNVRSSEPRDNRQYEFRPRKLKAWVILFCIVRSLLAPGLLPAREDAVAVERAVPVRMRDGVVLFADIYRPAKAGRFPVLLERTPYDKGNDKEIDLGDQGPRRGYVVIVQDVRGRYTSGGEWYPFRHESEDGVDTIEWAASLPYSDGRVGMFGSSYVGATQMLAAIAHPPHLVGICPMFTPSNYHNGWVYLGGAFQQWFNETWTSILARDTVDRYLKTAARPEEDDQIVPLTDYPLFHLNDPLASGHLTARFAPYFLDWLAHPSFDAYWRPWSIEDHYGDINVPALTVAAWYDIFLGGSLRNYLGVGREGGSEAAKQGQLLVTIGGHAGSGRKIGDVDFGPAAAEFDEAEVTLAWYDFLFYGKKNRFSIGSPVRIFVMGRNTWRDEKAWPLARAKSTRFYLHSAGGANSVDGNGALSTESPAVEPPDKYQYDPRHPVPTTGGPLCCDAHQPAGAQDQRAVEKLPQVLVYSTGPFASDTEVTGPISVELYAASSAVDTDFTAKLVDVDPSGFARNLTEGIVRARYRDSQTKPDELTPGRIYKFTIDLWATSNDFLTGHKLRLEISSSNFPRFDRNLNLSKPSGIAIRSVVANNSIFHDAAHPSALILPILQNDSAAGGRQK
jgi:putative CocE/NonD family hydrolase